MRHLFTLIVIISALFLCACGGQEPVNQEGAVQRVVPVMLEAYYVDGADEPVALELAAIIDDSRPVSEPAWRDEKFTPAEQRGGRLVVGTFGDPRTFNVIIANDSSSSDIIDRCWVGLLNYDNETQAVVDGAAHSLDRDETGMMWTFHLREGMVFSDGSSLTSEDFARFMRVIYTEGLTNPKADIMSIGGEPFTWETPDPLTFVLKTPDIFATLPLQATGIFPLPADPWEAALQSENPGEALANLHGLDVELVEDDESGEMVEVATDTEVSGYVCNGPFVPTQYLSGEKTVLRRNPNFQMWDAAGNRLPNLDEVVFVILPDQDAMKLRFMAGETDELNPIRPSDYAHVRDSAAEGDYTVWELGPGLSKSFFWFNLNTRSDEETGDLFVDPVKSAWFNTLEFRQACSHAFDRQSLINLVLSGRGTPKTAYESISNRVWCNTEATHYPFDQARARELLDSIDYIDRDGDGVREDPEGNPIKFTMITNRGNESRERIIIMLQQDLAAVGIDMTPSLMDFPSLVERLNDTYRYDACFLGLGGGTPDPTTGLNVLRSSGRTHLWNPSQETPATEAEARIDELCDDLVTTLDQSEQVEIYKEIQEILGRECYMIWSADANLYIGTTNRMGNYQPAIVDNRTLWNVESIWSLSAE